MEKNESKVVESNERCFTSIVNNEVWKQIEVTVHSISNLFERTKKLTIK